MSQIRIEDLLDEGRFGLSLELVAGRAGLSQVLSSDQVAAAGLHLAGFTAHFQENSIQVFGRPEAAYLESLGPEPGSDRLRSYLKLRPAAIVLIEGLPVPPVLSRLADETGISLFSSTLESAAFFTRASYRLEAALAPKATLHGVLMDVFGVGILITGESGIGKSEVALDLILRGHRFIADDVVEVVRRPEGSLAGRGADLIRHHIEIRGLGILNVKDLFGVAAVRETKKIELQIELIPWTKSENVDRTGLDERKVDILGVSIPSLQVPVSPGRNITSIVEVAARNQLLRWQGIHSAKEFQAKLLEDISRRTPGEGGPAGELE